MSSDSARLIAREIYLRLGVAEGDVEVLRELPTERLLAAQAEVSNDVVMTRDAERFGAEAAETTMTFQPELGGEVLPAPTLDALTSGDCAVVDLLIGHTKEELRLHYALYDIVADDAMVDALFNGAFADRAQAALATYRGNRPDASATELMAALETDRIFRIPSLRVADAHASLPARTYFYRLSWSSPALDGRLGAGHAVDLPFVFDVLDEPLGRYLHGDAPPQRLADAMHQAWVAFVTAGDPHHDGLPTWPEYDAQARAVMDFDVSCRIVRDPDASERLLWYARGR